MLFFDIDHFKDVNDAYGHAMGDSFLRKIKELRGVSRLEEDIYRYGGDEFVQIVENIEEEELIHIIERYQSTAREISSGLLGNAPLVENMKPETTVRRETDFSIGIAKFLPNDTADTLMARADVAMQHAKLHEGTASIAYGGSEAEMNYRQIN